VIAIRPEIRAVIRICRGDGRIDSCLTERRDNTIDVSPDGNIGDSPAADGRWMTRRPASGPRLRTEAGGGDETATSDRSYTLARCEAPGRRRVCDDPWGCRTREEVTHRDWDAGNYGLIRPPIRCSDRRTVDLDEA
jgi:hypothetical protein